jgi:hypothetical protein
VVPGVGATILSRVNTHARATCQVTRTPNVRNEWFGILQGATGVARTEWVRIPHVTGLGWRVRASNVWGQGIASTGGPFLGLSFGKSSRVNHRRCALTQSSAASDNPQTTVNT